MTFKANAQWNTGARGKVQGDPAASSIEFSAPPEFHGESGVWSPEHFLMAAVASCFVTTFRVIADISKFHAVSLVVAVEGVVEKGNGGYEFTQVTMDAELSVSQESDQERGMRLLQKTEGACLISRSLKAPVTMRAKVGMAQ